MQPAGRSEGCYASLLTIHAIHRGEVVLLLVVLLNFIMKSYCGYFKFSSLVVFFTSLVGTRSKLRTGSPMTDYEAIDQGGLQHWFYLEYLKHFGHTALGYNTRQPKQMARSRVITQCVLST